MSLILWDGGLKHTITQDTDNPVRVRKTFEDSLQIGNNINTLNCLIFPYKHSEDTDQKLYIFAEYSETELQSVLLGNTEYVGLAAIPEQTNSNQIILKEMYFISPFECFKLSSDDIKCIPLHRDILNTDYVIHKTYDNRYYFQFNKEIIDLDRYSNLRVYKEDIGIKNIVGSYLIFRK